VADGQIALISSVIAFIFAGITLVLSGLGLWHFRKVSVDEEIRGSSPPGSPRQQLMARPTPRWAA